MASSLARRAMREVLETENEMLESTPGDLERVPGGGWVTWKWYRGCVKIVQVGA